MIILSYIAAVLLMLVVTVLLTGLFAGLWFPMEDDARDFLEFDRERDLRRM